MPIQEGATATNPTTGQRVVFTGGKWKPITKTMPAFAGSAPSGGGKVEANDRKSLMEAADRAAAASSTLRLYDRVQPSIDRFNGGPMKGTMYDMVMPNGGGFWDKAGALLGAPVRALLPQQDKDDYQRIQAARMERIALRQKEQKGPQTDRDAAMYGKSDIAATNSNAVNHSIMNGQRVESMLTRVRAQAESQWVARYGSTSHASPNGMTFQQFADKAAADYQKRAIVPPAPPSTRRANSGWSAVEEK